jgi:hypothetical protein
MKRILTLAAVLALGAVVPVSVQGRAVPVKITLKSWQVIVNGQGAPIKVANHGTFKYCPSDGVTHIYAIGKAKPAKKGLTYSITWKLNGKKIVTLTDYKTKKNGFVLAPLHRSDNTPLGDGAFTAVKKNGSKTSSITITLKADEGSC